MKTSEIYWLAQCAVLDSQLAVKTKLEIVRELIEKEDVALYCEKKEEEKEKQNETV